MPLNAFDLEALRLPPRESVELLYPEHAPTSPFQTERHLIGDSLRINRYSVD